MTSKSRSKKKLPSTSLVVADLISLADAAKIYKLSHGYLRQLAIKGRLKAQKVGRDWLTSPADIEEYIATREKRGVYRTDLK